MELNNILKKELKSFVAKVNYQQMRELTLFTNDYNNFEAVVEILQLTF